MANKKILQITTVKQTIEAFLLPFANAFSEEGWVVHAAAENATSSDAINESHSKVFNISFSRSLKNISSVYKSFKQIRKLIIEEGYDIVHVHTPIAAFITRFACLGLSSKVFYTAHGFHYNEANSRFKNICFYMLEKIALIKTDHLFVINEDDLSFALNKLNCNENKVTKLNGIGVRTDDFIFSEFLRKDFRNSSYIEDDCFVILQIAELNDNKNHKLVFRSLSDLLSSHPDFNFKYLIVGSGPHESSLKKLSSEMGLEKYTTFLGHRKDIRGLISACDLLVLSSKREGLPRCIMEAMSAKKTVVANDIRGCRDLLGSGAGMLVQSNDQKMWSNAIYHLYRNPSEREHRGDIGFMAIKAKYEEKIVVSHVISVYKKV